MPRLTAARCADTVLASAVAAPALAVTAWSVLAGQSPPWPVVAMLGIAAAAMFARHTWPVAAALVTSITYVLAVQSGGFDLHGSSPGTIAGTIGTGIAVPALCYTLGSSVRLPRSPAWPS